MLDPTTRQVDGGSTLIGGSPVAVLRLHPAGAALVGRLVAGEPIPPGAEANRLTRRLLDLGLAHPRPPLDTEAPAVTAVIPVRDDPTGLAVTLAHLGPVEHVFVVDDGSADPAAVRRAAADGPHASRTQVIRLEVARGPAGARQAGWPATTTEVVAFVDADCAPEPEWLGPLVAHLADPAVAAVAPRVRARPGPETPAWIAAYEAIRSPLDMGSAAASVRPCSRVGYVPTAALVVRRAALVEVGGFDPGLRYGEDVDLVWRLVAAGHDVRFEPTVSVGHAVRPTLGAWLRQRFDYGGSAAPLAERHGPAVAPLTVSPWSAGAWVLAALGHPVLGAGLAGASTAALGRRLRCLQHPWAESFRLAGGGHLHAGRLFIDACRRSWWPLVLVACLASRRARRVALVGALVPPLLESRPAAERLSRPAWVALRLADDLAYGLGVWAGAWRARSVTSLRPTSPSAWPTTSPTVSVAGPASGLLGG